MGRGRHGADRARPVRHLRVDVERVVVTRDRQRAVALRIPVSQALGVVGLAVHPDPLDGGGHVGVAVLEHLGAVATGEVLVARRYVVPQHDDRPVEGRCINRTQDDHPGLVGGSLHRLDLPATVPVPGRSPQRARSGRPRPPGSIRRRGSPPPQIGRGRAERPSLAAGDRPLQVAHVVSIRATVFFIRTDPPRPGGRSEDSPSCSPAGPELALEHLAGRVPRQRLDERDLFGDLEPRQLRPGSAQ